MKTDYPAVEIAVLDAGETQARLDALAEILADVVAGGASVNFMSPFSVAEARAWWQGVIPQVAAGQVVLLAASVAGRTLGTAQLQLARQPNQQHRAEVAKMLVHRAGRRRGLARALMLRLEDEARARDRTLLTLDTASEAAEALYRGLGYTCAGIIPDYARMPDGPLCATSLWWKRLAVVTPPPEGPAARPASGA